MNPTQAASQREQEREKRKEKIVAEAKENTKRPEV